MNKGIIYNPSLSVKENALRNGVPEKTIRCYIKVNHLDRRYDRKKNIIEKCQKYLKNNPNSSKTELHKATGFSMSTIHKYWQAITGEEILIDFCPKKAKKRMQSQSDELIAPSSSSTKVLLSYELFGDKVFMPFCFDSSMAVILSNAGYEVKTHNILNENEEKKTFFPSQFTKEEYDIIANLPYESTLIAIINKCLQICNNKVAMYLPLTYLSGRTRYDSVFKKNPPARVLICNDSKKDAKTEEGGEATFAWYIWEKGYRSTTEIKWLQYNNKTEKTIIENARLKQEIRGYVEQEQKNSDNIKKKKPLVQYPRVEDLFKQEREHYDASLFKCYAFRRKDDMHENDYIPLGNMNQGFSYIMNGINFHTSESAYICGLFSDDSAIHQRIQRQLIDETNGYEAKKTIRAKNEVIGRKDWNEFNVEWMLYVVWNKVKGNEEFRNILLSIPQDAIIIENTTYQQVKANDTSAFWGCRNAKLKEFHSLYEKYLKQMIKSNTKRREKLMDDMMNNFCGMGVFEGNNTMGKILMIVKKCLHEGTEPLIDYDLLNRKNIHLLGTKLSF